MVKTSKKKTPPARAKTGAAPTAKPRAAKPTAVPARRSGPEKGISRSPIAIFERALRDLEIQAGKLHRQAERLGKDDKPTARLILATAKGLDKLVEKGADKAKKAA